MTVLAAATPPVLPETGGMPTVVYYLVAAGLGLLLIGGGLLVRNRRVPTKK